MENVEHLILEHLKALRSGVSRLEADMQDVKSRLLTLESYQAATHLDSTRQSGRIDDLDERLLRIERRLELRDDSGT